MGTIFYSLAKSGRNPNVAGRLVTSGAHTSSTTATNLTDGDEGGGTAITASEGDILTLQTDEAGRVQFGGVAATATLGHMLWAGETATLEVSGPGAISVIDIA